MTITALTLFQAQVTEKTDWLFLRMEDAGGWTGWGEASLDGMSDKVAQVAQAIFAELIGQDAAGLFARFSPRALPEAAVCSALVQASADIAAQVAGKPLAQHLRPGAAATVPLYANINRRNRNRNPETIAESARLAKVAGFDAIKIAPFDEVQANMTVAQAERAMQAGLERIAAVRTALGADSRLMIDCHWRFARESAAAMISAAAEYSPWWIECPIAETAATRRDIRLLRGLSNDLGIRLAGLELEIGRAGFRPWIDAACYDVMMPDIKYAGGPYEMVCIAEEMAAAGVTFSPHNPTGPIAHLQSLHLCAAVGEVDLLEQQFDETPLFNTLTTPPPPNTSDGSARLPDAPGLGAALNLASVQMTTRAHHEGRRP